MKTDKETIYEILLPRVDHALLKNYSEGIFNEKQDRFIAYTHVSLDTIDYSEFEYNLRKVKTVVTIDIDEERMRNYITSNSLTYKSTEECIKENILNSYSVNFTGMCYENEWYITTGVRWFEDKEQNHENCLPIWGTLDKFWNSNSFIPDKPIVMRDGTVVIDNEMAAFGDMPQIVAEIKKEKKAAINRAFSRYMNEEVFLPFVEKLKINWPENYNECISLYSNDYTLIYPENKKYVIMIMLASNNKEEYRITYFLYLAETKKMYQWNYFEPEVFYHHGFFYGLEVIEDLNKISDWNHHACFNSSKTMDHEEFWNNYVFKKADNEYVYLQEVTV